MALYYFRCTKCSTELKRIMEPEQLDGVHSWPKCKCGSALERTPRGPSTSVMETIDNGWQARKIERPANVVDLVYDRNVKHDMEHDVAQPDELDLERVDDGEKI